jgi:hypothetical protein
MYPPQFSSEEVQMTTYPIDVPSKSADYVHQPFWMVTMPSQCRQEACPHCCALANKSRILLHKTIGDVFVVDLTAAPPKGVSQLLECNEIVNHRKRYTFRPQAVIRRNKEGICSALIRKDDRWALCTDRGYKNCEKLETTEAERIVLLFYKVDSVVCNPKKRKISDTEDVS